MLDNNLIENILKTTHKTEDVKIVSCNQQSAMVLGENWCNNLITFEIEAKINGENRVFNWMGKFPPENSSNQNFVLKARLDEKEITFYSDFVPALNQFVDGRVVLNLCPVHFSKFDENGKSFFIMENLKAGGYQGSVGKTSGLDFDHCKLLLQELSKFHAASNAFMTQNEDQKRKWKLFLKDFWNLDAVEEVKTFNEDVGATRLDYIRQTLEFIQNPGDNYLDKLDGLIAGRNEAKLRDDSFSRNQDGFNVLIHNDVWICNLLYKYDSTNKPETIVVVDWATVYWNNPAIDVANFLMTSTNSDVLNNHFDELMNVYYKTLVETLKQLGINEITYSFKDLMKDYDRNVLWASLKALTWIPINLGQKSDIAAAVSGETENLSQGAAFGAFLKAVGKVVMERIVETSPEVKLRLRAIFDHVLQRLEVDKK